jgi:DNA-binding transcriptional ArsR family regulator
LRVRDPQVMRALAHPARVAIIERLMTSGPSTATECAEVVGLSPSATSYHLRALARAGLVEEAPSRGDGRERVWQSPAYGLEIDADTSRDAEAFAAEQALMRVVLDRQDAKARQWAARSREESSQWREAATFTEGRLLMTAQEVAELQRAIADLIDRYRVRVRQEDPPPGARTVRAIVRLFPDPI